AAFGQWLNHGASIGISAWKSRGLRCRVMEELKPHDAPSPFLDKGRTGGTLQAVRRFPENKRTSLMAQRHLVGLDIGSKFFKAVQLTQTAGQYKVTEFGIAEVSPQVSIPDTVNELFSKKNFKTKRVVSAVSGRFVFVRYISMPVMSDEELVNAAKYELGKYIPVEVDEVLHDSQKLEDLAAQEGQEPEMRVLLVAAKRT